MPPDIRTILARNLSAARRDAGHTQASLSRRSGVPQTTISAVERRVHAASVETVAELARALNLPPYLLLHPDPPPQTVLAAAERLIHTYTALPEDGRAQVDRVLDAESRYAGTRKP